MIALVDLTVVQGETRSLEVTLPAGYELTGVSGNSLETSEVRDGTIVLTLADPALRRHQFLVTLERAHAGGSFELDTGLVAVQGVQRERGEAAIEGTGTLDLSIAERTGMQRVDVRELNASMRSLARSPLLAGFRYQRTPSIAPGLTLAVARFADAGVLAAAVERAEATTLVTAEGRALTEVKLHVQNRAQPFLRVTLPHWRFNRVGRGRGPDGQAGARRRRHARAAPAARIPSARHVPRSRMCTCTPGRHSARRAKSN